MSCTSAAAEAWGGCWSSLALVETEGMVGSEEELRGLVSAKANTFQVKTSEICGVYSLGNWGRGWERGKDRRLALIQPKLVT